MGIKIRYKKQMTAQERKKILHTITSWLRSNIRREFAGKKATYRNLTKAVQRVVDLVEKNLCYEVRKELVMFPCEMMWGLIHLSYGPKPVKFHECGCTTER